MNRRIGLTLRLMGPLVEIACLAMLNRYGEQGRAVAGVPVDRLLYAGLFAGLVMVVVGLAISRPDRPRTGRGGDLR